MKVFLDNTLYLEMVDGEVFGVFIDEPKDFLGHIDEEFILNQIKAGEWKEISKEEAKEILINIYNLYIKALSQLRDTIKI